MLRHVDLGCSERAYTFTNRSVRPASGGISHHVFRLFRHSDSLECRNSSVGQGFFGSIGVSRAT